MARRGNEGQAVTKQRLTDHCARNEAVGVLHQVMQLAEIGWRLELTGSKPETFDQAYAILAAIRSVAKTALEEIDR